jgi:hypothetical protein
MTDSARYLSVLLAVAGLVLALILGLNLLLGERELGGPKVTQLASEWQEKTHGVTYPPPITRTGPFKALRLADRLPDVNTIVLGSSTLMGITADLFPKPLRLYNFALTANPTPALVGEAEYLVAHNADHIRFMLAGLDWSLSMIYLETPVPVTDLSPRAALSGEAHPTVSLTRRIVDAVSYPKVVNLLKALRSVIRSPHPVDAFRHTFFDVASAAYRCPDGTLARDFDVVRRGICAGFRYDGSWTFEGEQHLTPARAEILARAAAAPSSKFSHYLCQTGGEPNPEYLRRFGAVAEELARHGGVMVFLLPPLIPGMERAMTEEPASRRCLEHTKTALDAWALRHQVTIIDAGASERYGCTAGDFIDEHHAFPECHRKVLNFYFNAQRGGRVHPGLMRP